MKSDKDIAALSAVPSLAAGGLFNTATGLLSADQIKFRQARVRIEAAVNPVDITVGESLQILGITVRATDATEDDALLLAGKDHRSPISLFSLACFFWLVV